jgi:hypothetical protein
MPTPPVITPAGPLTKDGGALVDFTADQSVTWTATAGTLSPSSGTASTWTAPNESRSVTVTGTNGSGVDTVSIVVQGVFPNYWAWRTPIHAKKDVLVWRPIFGPSQTRGFGDGSAIHDWELGNEDSEITRFDAIKAFWEYHHPGRQFDLVDPVREERRTYEFDSDLDYHYNDSGGVTWSVRIKEAYPYAAIV